jgi:hypothetical protein
MRLLQPACIGLLILFCGDAIGQIVKPVLPPPPCQGKCPNAPHGVTIPAAPHPASPCPPGTVRDPSKSTCHVLP